MTPQGIESVTFQCVMQCLPPRTPIVILNTFKLCFSSKLHEQRNTQLVQRQMLRGPSTHCLYTDFDCMKPASKRKSEYSVCSGPDYRKQRTSSTAYTFDCTVDQEVNCNAKQRVLHGCRDIVFRSSCS